MADGPWRSRATGATLRGVGRADRGGAGIPARRQCRASLDLRSPGRYHIVGVGGRGMSAIALVLAEMGHPVSGSDLRAPCLSSGCGPPAIGVVGHDRELVARRRRGHGIDRDPGPQRRARRRPRRDAGARPRRHAGRDLREADSVASRDARQDDHGIDGDDPRRGRLAAELPRRRRPERRRHRRTGRRRVARRRGRRERRHAPRPAAGRPRC